MTIVQWSHNHYLHVYIIVVYNQRKYLSWRASSTTMQVLLTVSWHSSSKACCHTKYTTKYVVDDDGKIRVRIWMRPWQTTADSDLLDLAARYFRGEGKNNLQHCHAQQVSGKETDDPEESEPLQTPKPMTTIILVDVCRCTSAKSKAIAALHGQQSRFFDGGLCQNSTIQHCDASSAAPSTSSWVQSLPTSPRGSPCRHKCMVPTDWLQNIDVQSSFVVMATIQERAGNPS